LENWDQQELSLASNWTSGTVPNGNDDVTINATGAYTVTVNGGEEANSLTFNAPNAIINFAVSSNFLLHREGQLRMVQLIDAEPSTATLLAYGRLLRERR
jgi:hypothetical protein